LILFPVWAPRCITPVCNSGTIILPGPRMAPPL